jgi:hypothetical protein
MASRAAARRETSNVLLLNPRRLESRADGSGERCLNHCHCPALAGYVLGG